MSKFSKQAFVTIIDGQDAESETRQAERRTGWHRGPRPARGLAVGPLRKHLCPRLGFEILPPEWQVSSAGFTWMEETWSSAFRAQGIGKVIWHTPPWPLRILSKPRWETALEILDLMIGRTMLSPGKADHQGSLLSGWPLFSPSVFHCRAVFLWDKRAQLRLPRGRIQGKGRDHLEQE